MIIIFLLLSPIYIGIYLFGSWAKNKYELYEGIILKIIISSSEKQQVSQPDVFTMAGPVYTALCSEVNQRVNTLFGELSQVISRYEAHGRASRGAQEAQY